MGRFAWAWFAVVLAASSLPITAGRAMAQPADDWPRFGAPWSFEIVKDPGTVPPPHEPFDLDWLHLHRGHPSLPDATINAIAPVIVQGHQTLDPTGMDLEVRYVLRGVVLSDWLAPPFRFDLDIDNPALGQLADGVHGLTIEARGSDRYEIQPLPAFVHLTRDLAAGQPFGFERTVPIINSYQEFPTSPYHAGSHIVYVDPDDREFTGHPVDSTATSWSAPPLEAGLYQELMAPHTELFHSAQMWWDHVAHADAPYVRGMPPKHGEDHRRLRVDEAHERFPMQDGPRGVGWMSPYVSGSVDSQGRFAFAETGGRVGYLMPDGEVITLAGWRVRPDVHPLWWEKPTDIVRQNMENRGIWTAGRGEFFTPLDVAIDPLDENVLYVASYEDHVIWKIDVPADPRNQPSTVSILAGDPGHGAGFVDGAGSTARFNGPASLVFDPVADVLYVADQDNDAIRRVTRDGAVTTVAGNPGMQARVAAAGVDWTDQVAARAVSQFEVSAADAGRGASPDIYLPQTIRVDSQGRIVLLEIGFGAIRRIDPTTLETTMLGEVRQKHREFDRGWAWLDVDRWGNSGPVDGIYWTKFVSNLDGELFNEVFEWLPPEGGESVPLFDRGTGLHPDGWGPLPFTNPPHYGWLVAVDPRGGVLMSGGGEHGLTRLRPRRATDPVHDQADYWLGRQVYASGVPVDAPLASESVALRGGWGGHNYLGLTDAWQLRGATDEVILDAFDVAAVVRNDPDARRQLLAFLRPNTIGSTAPPDPPTPPTPPAVPPGDVTCDDRLDLRDTIAIVRYVVGGMTPVGACPLDTDTEILATNADLDGNGRVDLGDAVMAAQCAVGGSHPGICGN